MKVQVVNAIICNKLENNLMEAKDQYNKMMDSVISAVKCNKMMEIVKKIQTCILLLDMHVLLVDMHVLCGNH